MRRSHTLQSIIAWQTRAAALSCMAVLAASRPAVAAAPGIAVGGVHAILSTYDGVMPGTGLKLIVHGRPLITRSSVSVASPDWSQGYFSLGRASGKTTISDVPGGKRLLFAAANDAFSMTYAVDVLEGNRVVLDLQGTLRKPVPAILEYAAGYLSATLLTGEPYTATTASGERKGRIPFWSQGTDPKAAMVMPPLRRIGVATRAGMLEVEAEGDTAGLDLFDARMVPQAWLQESPVFWLGNLAAPLEAGRPFRSRIAIRFTPAARAPQPGGPVRVSQPVPVRDQPSLIEPPAAVGSSRVIPSPQEWRTERGAFPIGPQTRIVYAAGAASRRAARELRDRLAEEYGVRVPAVPAHVWPDRRHAIAIGTLESERARWWIAEAGVEPVRHPEGYTIRVAPASVTLVGADARGALYGVFTLLQMVTRQPDLHLPAGVVRDWPAIPVRGVHLLTDHWSTFLHRDLIRGVLAPHKINTILLECEYVKWDRHPELHVPWGMSKDEVRALLALARDYSIEVIPLVQTLGHVGWMFQNNQHLDLAEDPQAKYAYCPSNPRTYDLIFDVLDEALELFGNPRYLHIGHDEFTHRGKFAQEGPCRGRSPADLFVEDTRRLHGFLAQRGVRTLMWGDMLLGPGEAADATHATTTEEARRVRDALPKDILITDWHYAPAADYPSVRTLRQAGFDVWAATWNHPRNVFGFAQEAARHATGLIQTTWTGYNGNMTALRREFPQFWAYVLAAEYAWSPGAPPLDEAVAASPYRFIASWPGLRNRRQTPHGFVVDLAPVGRLPWDDTPNQDGWMGYGPSHDMSRLPAGLQRLGGTLFLLPENRRAVALASPLLPRPCPSSVAIPLNRRVSTLVFLWGTGWEAPEGQEVGRVVLRYADGNELGVPLRYGWNIRAFRDPRIAFQAPVVWNGTTAGGDPVLLRAHSLWNPLPRKDVLEIRFDSAGTDAAPVVLAVSGTGE